MLSEQQIAARDCLRYGSALIDPKYFPAHIGAEAKLKERCKECWSMRAHFPAWVTAYCEKWRIEKEQGNAT